MNLLLDTHLLVWSTSASHRLSPVARALIDNPDNQLFFSAASLWELAIKQSLGKKGFNVDARLLRHELLNIGYTELPVTSNQAVAIDSLPVIHRDPFDRILIIQATLEGITLLTVDRIVARYPGPIRKV
ncbi:MAG: type II toxin-antitoxin system VapC family toxin [Edaphobacter sp.]